MLAIKVAQIPEHMRSQQTDGQSHGTLMQPPAGTLRVISPFVDEAELAGIVEQQQGELARSQDTLDVLLEENRVANAATFAAVAAADSDKDELERAKKALDLLLGKTRAEKTAAATVPRAESSGLPSGLRRPSSSLSAQLPVGITVRGPGRKHGTPFSGWQQQLVSRIEVPDHGHVRFRPRQ